MYGHIGWPGRKAPGTLMSRNVPASWRVSSCSHRAQALAMPPRWYLGRDMREEDDLALGLLGLKPLALRGKKGRLSCLPYSTMRGTGVSMNRTSGTGHQAQTKTTIHCSPQSTLSSISAHTKCSSHNYKYLGLDVIGSLIYLVILILI